MSRRNVRCSSFYFYFFHAHTLWSLSPWNACPKREALLLKEAVTFLSHVPFHPGAGLSTHTHLPVICLHMNTLSPQANLAD